MKGVVILNVVDGVCADVLIDPLQLDQSFRFMLQPPGTPWRPCYAPDVLLNRSGQVRVDWYNQTIDRMGGPLLRPDIVGKFLEPKVVSLLDLINPINPVYVGDVKLIPPKLMVKDTFRKSRLLF